MGKRWRGGLELESEQAHLLLRQPSRTPRDTLDLVTEVPFYPICDLHPCSPWLIIVWRRLTDSNLATAILSLVIFLARAIMAHLDYLPRYANVLYDTLLASLWTLSLVGQTSEDCSDPEHPSTRPWYLTHSCSESWGSNRGYCRVAQTSFAFSVLAAALYFGRLVREALLVAYRRGRARGNKEWTAVGTEEEVFEGGDEVDEADEEKYSDGDRLLTPRGERFDQALSPVLAFFPSSTHLGR
jgi:hypothetical protein